MLPALVGADADVPMFCTGRPLNHWLACWRECKANNQVDRDVVAEAYKQRLFGQRACSRDFLGQLPPEKLVARTLIFAAYPWRALIR
jgi:hypothetical protein